MLTSTPLGSGLLDHWDRLREYLPRGFELEATARSHGAFSRVREVKSAEALLRLALAYGACGMSLRETCAWAEATGLASLSDPALIERLAKSAAWLGELVRALVAEQAGVAAGRWAGYRLRAIDATSICAPGADRTTWRLHAGYDLARGQIDQLDLTEGSGAESLKRFAFRAGDIAIADRGYARPRDLRPVLVAGADLIVRTGWNSLRLCAPEGSAFDLFATLAGLGKKEGETPVRVHEGSEAPGQPLLLRLVIRRKSAKETMAAQERLLKEAKKRGKKPDPRSLEAARYILLLTSLPAGAFSAADVLALYRMRWQIELAFKRFKSLAGLDTLPAKKPDLARAWIYARLIAVLLADRIAGQVPAAPPSGAKKAPRKPVTLAPRQVGAGRHPRRHSRANALAAAPPHMRKTLSLPS